VYKIKIPDSYMLSNNLGSFYLWTDTPYTRRCGLFFNINNCHVKCLEKISISSPLKKTSDAIIGVLNQRKELVESYYMQEDSNTIACNLSHPADMTIKLDVRRIGDIEDWGRNYKISKEQGCIVIKCTKENSHVEYEYYVAIKSKNTVFKDIDKLVEVDYKYSERRNSRAKQYVYDAVKLFSSFITLSMSENKRDAIRQATALFKRYNKLRSKDMRSSITVKSKFAPKEINDAYKNSHYSIQKLISDQGIYAGCPYSPQIRTRDELISIKYLIARKQYKKARDIFSKYFEHESYCGRLPATLPNIGKTIDGLGWLGVRFHEFLVALDKEGELFKLYKKREFKTILEFFDRLVFFIKRYHQSNGLIKAKYEETWMNTSYKNDKRDGYCIEIQALTLRLFSIMHELTNEPQYKLDENDLKKTTLKKFLKKDVLADRLTNDLKEDKHVRPNMFLAYYVYPQLLSKQQWEKVFDKALKSLWLEWGGLSSIGKKDKLFISNYSGNNNNSLHHGDSWFYINCISAISMYKLNKKKYLKYIEKIIKACYTDCLEQGIIGSIAEISSASKLNGYGNLSQATSLSMFIELIDLVYE